MAHSYPRFKKNAGGMNVEVGGGTIRPASNHPAQAKRTGSGVNGSGKGPRVSQPTTSSSHSPKGGRPGKTPFKIARQKKGGRRPYPL